MKAKILNHKEMSKPEACTSILCVTKDCNKKTKYRYKSQ